MKIIIFLALVFAQISMTGCSQLMGGLRRDFDDGDVYSTEAPTTGGRWAERGLLEDENTPEEQQSYAAVGHAERGLASVDETQNENQSRWGKTGEGNTIDAYGARQMSQNRSTYARPKYKNGNRATRSDFIDEATNEGSLWAPEGQTNYYFTKNKIRSVGDIVNVTIDEQLLRDVSLEIKRSLTKSEQQTELDIAQAKLIAGRAPAAELTTQDPTAKTTAKAPKGLAAVDPDVTNHENEKDKDVRAATMKDVDLSGAVELKANDTLMAEIVERYPNGNYKIRGTKRVIYKNGSPRLLEITAIARAQDISEEDVVNSGKLYEYRLEALR